MPLFKYWSPWSIIDAPGQILKPLFKYWCPWSNIYAPHQLFMPLVKYLCPWLNIYAPGQIFYAPDQIFMLLVKYFCPWSNSFPSGLSNILQGLRKINTLSYASCALLSTFCWTQNEQYTKINIVNINLKI